MEKLKKLINQIFDATENLIYSVKYLQPILYFGTVAWLIYIIYYDVYLENEIQIFGYVWDGKASDLFYLWFIYITFLSLKNYGKK
ncbi:hypothetical protein N9J98_05095 [Flavobacteriaceae bacterium]|nr:hypothetical protein [Flavobacteriaceae bacterium]